MALLLRRCGPVLDPRRPRCSFSSFSGLPPGARARHSQPKSVCAHRVCRRPVLNSRILFPSFTCRPLGAWLPLPSPCGHRQPLWLRLLGSHLPSLSCSGVSPRHYKSDSFSLHPGSLAASRAPWGPGPSRMIRTREALALLPAGAGPSRGGHTGQPQPREHGGGGLHVTAHGWPQGPRCLREVGAAVCQAGHQGDSSSRPGGAGVGRCRLRKGAQGRGHMPRTAPRPRHLQG